MKTKWYLVLVASLTLFVWMGANVLAAPMPPVLVANHETKECGEIFGGDECTDCYPPEGWEVLGFSENVQCPSGYTLVGQVDYTCQPFKVEHCCTEGHSGAPGDCEDLVVNNRTKQCAFVDDIQACTLPKQWKQAPPGQDSSRWVCPSGYQWIAPLPCEAEAQDEPTSLPATRASEEATSPPTTGGNEQEDTRPGFLPCVGGLVMGPAIGGLWLLARRHQQGEKGTV